MRTKFTKHYKWQTPKRKTSCEAMLIEMISIELEKAETVYDVEILFWKIVELGERIQRGMKAVAPRLQRDLELVEKARRKEAK